VGGLCTPAASPFGGRRLALTDMVGTV